MSDFKELPEDWRYWPIDAVVADPEKQKFLLREMIRRLENKGECCGAFHRLAFAVFQDDMGQ